MRIIGAALLVFAVTTHAIAEVRCLSSDTPRQCVQRLITTRAYDNTQAALAATNPGTSTVASPIRSAVKDFLSAGSAHVDGSSVKDSSTALILDYNFIKQFNLEATFPDPVASPAAASTATSAPSGAASTDTGTAALEQLSRGDDVLVTLSYNLLTSHFGRNIDRSLLDSILLPVISNTIPATAAVPATSYDTPFVQLFPDAAARVAAIAEYETTAIAALPTAAKSLGDDLANAASRQPQLFLSGLYRRRASQIGPDLHGFRLTWEIGTDNVNKFRSEEGRDCEKRGDCLEAFTNFAARTAKRHRTGRLALAIQYGKTALNDEGKFTEVATRGFTYLATYGQEISSFTAHPTRFDVSYTYDGTKTTHSLTTGSAKSSQHRASTFATPVDATVIPPSSVHDAVAFTITQPVGGNFSVPISVVRATHDDWLPGSNCAAPNVTPIRAYSPVSSPIPDPGPAPACGTLPTHRHYSKIEYHLAIRYQLPPFPHPPQNPCCCCQ